MSIVADHVKNISCVYVNEHFNISAEFIKLNYFYIHIGWDIKEKINYVLKVK